MGVFGRIIPFFFFLSFGFLVFFFCGFSFLLSYHPVAFRRSLIACLLAALSCLLYRSGSIVFGVVTGGSVCRLVGWLSCLRASHVWNKLVNCGSLHNRGEAAGEMAGE